MAHVEVVVVVVELDKISIFETLYFEIDSFIPKEETAFDVVNYRHILDWDGPNEFATLVLMTSLGQPKGPS